MSEKPAIYEIHTKEELEKFNQSHTSTYLLFFYSSESSNSLAALHTLEELAAENGEIAIAAVNAHDVRDIHPGYNITSVPTIVMIKNGHPRKRLEGKQSKAIYDALLHEVPMRREDGTEVAPLRITVYSTPSCPHCTTVKSYLRKHRFRFSEIDISRDSRASEELMSRSGSMGVPQTDINGTLVVGADMVRLNQLLNIR